TDVTPNVAGGLGLQHRARVHNSVAAAAGHGHRAAPSVPVGGARLPPEARVARGHRPCRLRVHPAKIDRGVAATYPDRAVPLLLLGADDPVLTHVPGIRQLRPPRPPALTRAARAVRPALPR